MTCNGIKCVIGGMFWYLLSLGGHHAMVHVEAERVADPRFPGKGSQIGDMKACRLRIAASL